MGRATKPAGNISCRSTDTTDHSLRAAGLRLILADLGWRRVNLVSYSVGGWQRECLPRLKVITSASHSAC
jgi:hypothetical protein